MRAERTPIAVAAALAACTTFQGVYREPLVNRLPAGDCVAEAIAGTRDLRLVSREVWHGDPSLTLIGAVAPMGEGEVFTWQLADGTEVELWLLQGIDGPRLWQLHDGASPPPSVLGTMRRIEERLIASCELRIDDQAATER